MAGKPQLAQKVKDDVLADLKQGKKYLDISNLRQLSLWTVDKVAKDNGIKRCKGRPSGEAPKSVTTSHYNFRNKFTESFIMGAF
jgi:hypothetical protein